MFVATVPNRKSPPAILLRESYREGGKVKTRTLLNVTSWPKARILALKRLLKGEFDSGISEQSEPQQGKAVGALYALSEIAGRIGLTKALGRGRKARLALMLVLARLMLQGSRLATVRWAEEEAVDEVLGAGKFDEDDLYATLDWLAVEQEAIEERLFKQRYGKTPPSLFLYDVTSSYLEGEENELADYGYNRDKKSGKKQIVIGLLTDHKGAPVAVRVFQGNTSDQNTVGEQVKALANSFGIKEVTLVGDRGMLKGPQIDKLPEGFRYITAITKPQIRSLMEKGILQYQLFDSQVCEVEHEGIRYILRRNPVRAEDMKESRKSRLSKLQTFAKKQTDYLAAHPKAKSEVAGKRVQTKLQQLKIAGWVKVLIEDRIISLTIDEAAEAEESLLDGCYVIKSDLSRTVADSQTIHDRYRALEQVERDFRTMKTGHLEVRPVYVRKESRTRGHVFVVMLALLIQRHIEACLNAHFAKASETPPVVEVIRLLDRICIYQHEVEGICLHKIIKPSPRQAELLLALNVSLPKRLVTDKMVSM